MTRLTLRSLLLLAALGTAAVSVRAAGTLTPTGSGQLAPTIRSHQVNVTINNGFAQTEVLQTFFNPNPAPIEAIYSCPVPRGASLSEVTLQLGEKTLQGEVLARAAAEQAYQEERDTGNEVGIASKHGYQTYEFRAAPVPAQAEVSVRFVYYQPLEIDTGVGRYVYPLADGGTDEVARSFWTANPQVEGSFRFQLELKSAWPVSDVRLPGFEAAAVTQRRGEGDFSVTLDQSGVKLDRDIVFYYRLADHLPGRIEVVPYRAAADKPGTFMLVVTPGIDLQPLTQGADYSFVLDVSGSMQTKLPTLVNGVAAAMAQLSPRDRFRVVTFNQQAREVIPWTAATPESAQQAIALLRTLTPSGGTNLHAGVVLGLKSIDADRATSLVLVTDGVANEGVVSPAAFHRLLQQVDIRVFGFLLGNNSNWPLLQTMADASGGFYAAVSNEDDITGQLLLAKSKITHEALHRAQVRFDGPVRIYDTTGDAPRKLFRGQQAVIFGRYDGAGKVTVNLQASLTGEDKTYTTTLELPEIATENPEIERLWALATIEQIESHELAGLLPPAESREAIAHLGVAYQLVTDHTSMLVLDDASHARRGITRHNQQRVAVERTAQAQRSGQPARVTHVDASRPAFPGAAPHVSRPSAGGGDVSGDVVFLLVMGGLLAAGAVFGRCRHGR